jgi:hypothetical protein
MRLAKMLPLVAVVGLLGCGEGTTEPNEADTPLLAMGGANPVVQSVTGSGQTTRPSGIWRTFSMNARKYADGTVEGQIQLNNHVSNQGWKWSRRYIVTCMAIEGNQAWIGGFKWKTDTEVVLRVVDNGEGKNADPDQISYIPGGNAAQFCVDKPGFPLLRDVEAGNIQVRQPYIAEYVISGGTDPGAGIFVDDILRVFLDGVLIYEGSQGGRCCPPLPPISFVASTGDILRVQAQDANQCYSLEALWLQKADGSSLMQLTGDIFGPNCDSEPPEQIFFDQTFTLP